jgi:apolipoprotein N-acyltransferase
LNLQGRAPARWPALPRLVEAAFAALLGALQTAAYDHTAAWPLPILTLSVLLWRLHAARPRRAALLGWCYGTAWLTAGTWWIFISLHRYGGLPAPLAVAAVLGLAAVLSLYLAAACAAYARWRRGSGWDALFFAALCLLAELARGVIFTGFPWLAVGYSQLDGPLAPLAPWVGVYGIGAVAVLTAALAVAAFSSPRLASARVAPARRVVPALLAAALVVLPRWLPSDFTRPAGDISVALLQTNVSQDEKFALDRMPEALAWTARELLVARADLVLAPETAVPLLPGQLAEFAPGYWASLVDHFQKSGSRALIGVPLGDYERGYTNSVAGLSPTPAYRYDKTHLVPFGEFIPTGFHWFTEMMNIPLGDFARGVSNPPSFAVQGQRVAPNICYEDLFGEELARRFVDASNAPTVFANISNIAWFGPSAIDTQHLNISRMRTLEFQVPMVRATNTGATAVIDHQGRVTARLAPYTRGVLQGRVQGREGVTPFARWAALAGLWPLWLGALAVVLAAVWLPHDPDHGRAWRRARLRG